MQRVLRKRVFRSLKKHCIRYMMLGLMIVMGIFLVVTIVGSAETLTRGTEKLAEDTRLEDGEFEVFVPLTDDEKADLSGMGIELSEQFYFDHLMDNENDGTVRIFKLRENINKIHYVSGKAPEQSNEIVIEKRYAYEHDIKAGDSFELAGNTFTVSGIGVVSDYDGPFKEISDTSCNSEVFGPVFVTEDAYEAYRSSGSAQKSEKYIYAYRLGEGNKDSEIKDYLKDLTVEGYINGGEMPKLVSFLKRDDNPRIFATKNDKVVDIEVGVMAGIIILILFAYVISVFVVHSIENESSIIGTLYSMGVTKSDLLLHYISLPVVVTFVSGLIGVLVASTGVMAPMVAESSYVYFSIPEFSFSVPGYLWIYSLVCPPLIAIVVNVLVINKKLNRTALSLIRNEAKQGKNRNLSLKNMNFISAFRIRQMLREMRSATAVVLGMFLSLLVFMISVNCFIMCRNISQDYEKDTKYEYMYTLKYADESVPEDAEKAYAYECKMKAFDFDFDVTLLGISSDNPYFDVDPGKSKMNVVVSSALAEKFGMKEGEEFIITDSEKEIKYAFSVRKIFKYSPSFIIFMNIDEMRKMMNKPEDYFNVVFSDEKLDINPETVYSTTSKADIVKGSKVFTDLMMPMVYVLTIASSIIFCLVLYLMMKVMIDRSSQNISLIKVFGYRRNEIRKLYLDGNFYIIAVGALVVIPLSKIIMNKLYPFMISNVSCGMDVKAPVLFYVVLYAVIIALYFVINTILVRRLDKYSPAEILKNRE